MRAPLSIVIPTLNAAGEILPTLANLTEGLNEGLIRELIISDGGSHDNTVQIANAAGAEVVIGDAGRGGQLARGAEASSGDWILFLHADTHLGEGWSNNVLSFIFRQDCAGYGDLHFRDSGFLPRATARGANLRSRLFSLPYGDQGLLISRRLYDSVGGYSNIALMEDVALAKALKGRLKPAGFQSHTGADRYRSNGYVKQVFKNWGLLTRYKLGADPADLAGKY